MTDDTKTWLNLQHPWLQEAAYRILSNGRITDQDIAGFVSWIKTPPVETNNTTQAPRTYPDFGVGLASTNQLSLESLGDIIGIDNLAPRNPLSFGSGNLTVIYGNNGSGKSGYARILKKACGKAGAAELKPNVYKPIPVQRQCTITLNINQVNTSYDWLANADPIPELSTVDIYDTMSGRIYLDGETEVAYIPAELVLFSDIVDVCKKVEKTLLAEQSSLRKILPELPRIFIGTTVASEYTSLRSTTASAQLTQMFPWSEDDERRLNELNERLKMTDPASEAVKRRAVKTQIDSLKSKLNDTILLIDVNACKRIQKLVNDANTARQTATEVALAMTGSSKLDGVSTETWRTLWDAARAYSISKAYTDKSYPNIDEGARCVLCHQILDDNAKDRLTDFNNYVTGTLESAAKTAEFLAVEFISALPETPADEVLQTAALAGELTEDMLSKLKSAWKNIKIFVDELRADPLNESLSSHSPDVNNLISELTVLSDAAEASAIIFDGDTEIIDRNTISTEILGLEAKKWTSQQSEAINAEVARLKQYDKFSDWCRKTTTTGISRKAGELSQTLITDGYVGRFNNELQKLCASNISVELIKTRVANGMVKHRIQLKSLNSSATRTGDILSEGETRIVSLAAFLADVTGKRSNAPFVFDDPISSLDHEYEWAVATRLAELARDRQVIVFTHRLSLYGGLEDAAKKVGEEWKNDHLKQLCIESFSGSCGHQVDDAIWSVNTKKANNILIDRLRSAKSAVDAGDSSTYRIIAQSICSDFRKLLERTIEEDLIAKVVLRHRRSLTTENRIKLLAKITHVDCVYFDDLMTKYSCYEHSRSTEIPIELPNESSLRADVEGLKQWRDLFVQRALPA
ncbi:MAG: AAA family ATPase [Chlorobium sp.]